MPPLPSFDARSLIATDDEIRDLAGEFARRRVGFTQAWLAESGIQDALDAVERDCELDWTGLGVKDDALAALRRAGFTDRQFHRVFAHPDVVDPDAGGFFYYRRLLSMSRKVFVRLFDDLARWEQRGGELSTESLRRLNEVLGDVARTPELDVALSERLVILAEGAAIDGEWRNQIGRIATWLAFEALMEALSAEPIDRATFRKKDNPTHEVHALTRQARSDLIDERWKPDRIELPGRLLRFGSQRVGNVTVSADITVAELEGQRATVIAAAGEVKGSTDPPTALDRWRIAAQNIEEMNRIRSGAAGRRPATMYLGLTITDGVVEGTEQTAGLRALLAARTLDAAFSLIKFSDEAEKDRFRQFIRPQLGLP